MDLPGDNDDKLLKYNAVYKTTFMLDMYKMDLIILGIKVLSRCTIVINIVMVEYCLVHVKQM